MCSDTTNCDLLKLQRTNTILKGMQFFKFSKIIPLIFIKDIYHTHNPFSDAPITALQLQYYIRATGQRADDAGVLWSVSSCYQSNRNSVTH